MIFYHVTPVWNTPSIALEGINPLRSQGKRKTIWLVSWSKLFWAIAHISAKRDMRPQMLIVYKLNIDRQKVKRTRMQGVYQYDRVARPRQEPQPAIFFLNLDSEPERIG